MRTIRVAAIQGRLNLISDPLKYAEVMYRYVRCAYDEGAHLVAFPEDNATHLLGLIPGIENMAVSTEDSRVSEGDNRNLVAQVFDYLGPVTRQVYQTTFATLAKLFGLYIMAGSMIIPGEDGQVKNTAHLYGPGGELIGTQDKVHLFSLEEQWGISCGSVLRVFHTPVGKISFPICMDASYWETFRILRFLGADLILVPVANPDYYNKWKALRGAWPRVQESQVYGVTSCLVGRALGITLTGKSSVYAPLDLTPGGNGILAEAKEPDREQVVTAEVNYDALDRLRTERPLRKFMNLSLYSKYFPGIYNGGEA